MREAIEDNCVTEWEYSRRSTISSFVSENRVYKGKETWCHQGASSSLVPLKPSDLFHHPGSYSDFSIPRAVFPPSSRETHVRRADDTHAAGGVNYQERYIYVI